MPCFRYDPSVTDRFPTIVGGLVHARGVTSGQTPPELVDAFRAEQAAVLERIGGTPLSELPTLVAWRRTFRGFGVDPTAYRSAAEALLRRLTKQGSIPSIGTLVDLGNLVSIRHGLPVSVMDQRAVTGGTTVRFAAGGERFTDLGSGAHETPEPGEVIFVDQVGLVSARRWCWRQSAESASGPGTTEILVTVEGHHPGASNDVAAALRTPGVLRTYASRVHGRCPAGRPTTRSSRDSTPAALRGGGPTDSGERLGSLRHRCAAQDRAQPDRPPPPGTNGRRAPAEPDRGPSNRMGAVPPHVLGLSSSAGCWAASSRHQQQVFGRKPPARQVRQAQPTRGLTGDGTEVTLDFPERGHGETDARSGGD